MYIQYIQHRAVGVYYYCIKKALHFRGISYKSTCIFILVTCNLTLHLFVAVSKIADKLSDILLNDYIFNYSSLLFVIAVEVLSNKMYCVEGVLEFELFHCPCNRLHPS
jgi:hypothetical protein